jgi:hypothetical protein
MNRILRATILSAVGISLFVISAVCWHSVEEIHYLKTFFPRQFSVEEAFYAAGVELIKVVIISVPFIGIIIIGLCLLLFYKRNT